MAKILIIDDDANLRKLYYEYLSRLGHEVSALANGDDILNYLNANRCDLAIIDIELESMSGLAVLKIMKTEFPEIPIILNSAFSVYKDDFSTWLADAYLIKSADLNPLAKKIENLVEPCETKI